MFLFTCKRYNIIMARGYSITRVVYVARDLNAGQVAGPPTNRPSRAGRVSIWFIGDLSTPRVCCGVRARGDVAVFYRVNNVSG